VGSDGDAERRDREIIDHVITRLHVVPEPDADLERLRLELRGIVDHLAEQGDRRAVQDAALTLCESNLREARARAERHRLETVRLASELERANEELAQARAEIERLLPYEVSAKLQLRSLRWTIPSAVAKRLTQHGPGRPRP
jgi:chromosome segregation ATPase